MSKTRTKKEPPKIHICVQCGSAFSRPYRLKQHEKIHQNIKEFICGETNCNKSYTNKSHLDRHIYSVHMEPAVDVIYSCPECMKVYVNRQNLKRHIKVNHGRKTGFTCDVCNNNYKKKHQLSAHMYEHTFVKSFSCELCNNEFITLLEKKKHMKHHKTYACNLCDMAFVQWSKYLKHKNMMHKEYICDDCGRKFNKRAHMLRHIKTHNATLYTPTLYPCTYENCDRVYTRNSNLKQHIKMKHLKVKHECEICFAKLSTKAKLLAHLKTHSKPRESILQTKKTGRKERNDRGAAKISTALRIAGLLIDPEDKNIRGTLKSIAEATTEQDVIADFSTNPKFITDSSIDQGLIVDKTEQELLNCNIVKSETKKDIIAESVADQNMIANSSIQQDVLADCATELNSVACDAVEVSIFEKVKEHEKTQKTSFKDLSLQQLCESSVS